MVLFIITTLIIIASSIRIVEQNTVAVIEFLGRYNRIMRAGLNFKIPLLERIAVRVSLRQQNFAVNGQYPSKDKVIISISTNLIYRVNESADGIAKYTYVLEDRKASIGAVIENSLRTYIARETHEGILEKKEELAAHIRADMESQFAEWGMYIVSFQITDVAFPKTITDAMSEVVASEQLRRAAENKGEAIKIQAVKEAEAEKERKRLQGEGIALERKAIAEGLRESIQTVQSVTQQNSREVIAILTLTQYLDTLKGIGMNSGNKVIFMDTNVNKTQNLLQEIIAAQEVQK